MCFDLFLSRFLSLSLPLLLFVFVGVYFLKKKKIYIYIYVYLCFYLILRGTTQVGSGGGGELLASWPEAMGLIIQLPSLPGWGEGELRGRVAA